MTLKRSLTLAGALPIVVALPAMLLGACSLDANELAGAREEEGRPPSGAPHTFRLTEVASYDLHGDTPTVAWSPDGQQLALADQVSYDGQYDTEEHFIDKSYAGSLSIIDVQSGQARKVYDGAAYHPAWLDGGKLAFGVDDYTARAGLPGIYVLDPSAAAANAERVAELQVHHLRASQEGKLLYWSGWPNAYRGWALFDLASKISAPIPGAPEACTGENSYEADCGNSWEPPAQYLVNQCSETAQGLEAGNWIEGGYVMDEDGSGTGRMGFDHADTPTPGSDFSTNWIPVLASISPDGLHAAFFTMDWNESAERAQRKLLIVSIAREELASQIADYQKAADEGSLTVIASDALPGAAKADYDCWTGYEPTQVKSLQFATAGGAVGYAVQAWWGSEDQSAEDALAGGYTVHLFDASGTLVAAGDDSQRFGSALEWLPDYSSCEPIESSAE